MGYPCRSSLNLPPPNRPGSLSCQSVMIPAGSTRLLRIGACLQRANAVDRRRQLLRARQAHLSRMSAEAAEGVEAVLPDRGECFRKEIPHVTDLACGDPLPDDTRHRFRLSGLGELFQVREVHPLAAELDGMKAFAPGGLAFTAPKVYRRGVCDALAGRTHFPGRERGAWRELLLYLAGAGCCVGGSVVFEQHHTVSHVQVVADPADDHDRRDA